MNILLVGMRFFGRPKTGSEVHLHYLAKEIRNHGDYVEIFTSTPRKIEEMPSFGFFYQNGIKINYMNDGKWILYNDFSTPSAHLYDEFRQGCFKHFLKENKDWDIIHFHHITPLSLIHIAKELGYYVMFTMHDYNAVDPTCHLISNKAIWDNPYGLASFHEISAEAFADEIRFQNSFNQDFKKNIPDNLTEMVRERVYYGMSILNETVDRIVSNGPYFIHHHLFWGIQVNHVYPLILWSRNMSPKRSYLSDESHQKVGLVESGKITFGVLDYFAPIKGQHFILNQIKRLKAYHGQFKVKFFGRFNDYQISNTQKISDILRDDPFLLEHIELNVKGYEMNELELICKRVDVVLSGSLVGAGSGTAGVEANLQGIPVLSGSLSENLRFCFHYLIGMGIQETIDELVVQKKSEFNKNPNIDYTRIINNDMLIKDEDVSELLPYYKKTLYDLTSENNNLADRMKEMLDNPQTLLELKQWMSLHKNRMKLYKRPEDNAMDYYLKTIYAK